MKKIIYIAIIMIPILLRVNAVWGYTDQDIDELKNKVEKLEAKQDRSTVVGGTGYIFYTSDMMEDSKVNKFDISRIYLDFTKKLDRSSSIRITTDIVRGTYVTDVDFGGTDVDTDTRFFAFLKYAYFELNDLGGFLGLDTFRFGQSATHWVDFSQKFWRFRYVQKPLTDYYGVFYTADLGFALLGNLSGFGLPKIDYHATFMNGTGDKKPEDNPQKNFAIRFGAEPFVFGENDKVTTSVGFYVKDYPVNGGETNDLFNVATALAAWEFSRPSRGLFFGEGFVGNASGLVSNGVSIGAQYELIPDVVLFGRIDSHDPDSSISDDLKNLNILGIEYNWGKNIRIALDYQNDKLAGNDSSKTLNVHSEVKW
ncbi:MAG: hypothetical protein NT030_04300 [Candidatus Saganbacteria bacterium]|nr:hypothetical protein [Candidatus Saganbacteria bacterium]